MAKPSYSNLQEAFDHSDLSLHDAWIRYFGLGGTATVKQLGEFLRGGATPDPGQHNVLAHALNERFHELGMNHPTPYAESAA